MFIVGLTGGIGSGKSTISQLFAELGVPIVDTDIIAHQLVSPGQDGLSRIVAEFGTDILTPAGELDRSRLRERVFRQPEKHQALEAILHPLIRRAALARIQELRYVYCILVVPLLVEKGWYTMVHRVLVVDAPVELQRRRVKQRSGLAESQIDAILRQQATREERLAHADDVIFNNDKTLQQLKIEVNDLHRKYRDMGNQAMDEDNGA